VKLGLVRQVEAFGKSPEVGVMYWNCRTDYINPCSFLCLIQLKSALNSKVIH
jgi:hypothetical protein